MNICFITKYPPIQGGVSTQCYWTARGLAERGHNVRVVTNAGEVEDVFRIELQPEDLAPGGPYQAEFPERGGRVTVDSTEAPDRRKIYYVPLGNPTVTRLVSRALDVIEDGCDVIYSQYLEPYGVAAGLVSAWTGTPLVFKHAGSDLHRLMTVPDLAPCYREVLRRAHRVITSGASRAVVQGHGVSDAQIVTTPGFSLSKAEFNPDGPAADLDRMLEAVRGRWAGCDDALAPLVLPLEPGLPVLGIYGKLGEQKGTFDLLNAAKILIDQGFLFHLVVMGRGWQEAKFGHRIVELGLSRYVRMLPFIAHWRVPSFLRACDVVAFLERDFPIRAHTPTIPTEVLSCGACLVVSAEVLRKQIYRAAARHKQNLVVVDDPRDAAALADAIRFALENPGRAKRIGHEGHRLTGELPDLSGYIDGMEEILLSAVGRPAPVRSAAPADKAIDDAALAATVERLFPYTVALLDPECRQVVDADLTGTALETSESQELALTLGERLLAALDTSALTHHRSMCRYELMMHRWASRREDEPPDDDAAAVLSGAEIARPTTRVRLRGAIDIQAFDYDVEELAQLIARRETIPDDVDSRFYRPDSLFVLFHRGSFPQKISPATAMLLMLLGDGPLQMSELRDRLIAALGARPDGVTCEELADIVEGLYWEDIVVVEADVHGTADEPTRAETTARPQAGRAA